MSGGIAYVWDPQGRLITNCNLGTVELDPVEEDEDVAELYHLIHGHHLATGSSVAESILDRWPEVTSEFVKVFPTDYKRVLRERRRHDEEEEAPVHDGELPEAAPDLGRGVSLPQAVPGNGNGNGNGNGSHHPAGPGQAAENR
jgi:hypothetical protein